MKNNKGFSLVELIVVIAIMAILATVAIPTFASFINKANVATDVDFLNNAEYAAELAYTADPAKEVEFVTVTLNDGAITKVTVYFVRAENVTEYTKAVVEKNDTTTTEEEGMILNTIDWNYTFKSEKSGEWKLDGKALTKVTTDTNNGEG